MDQGPSCNAAKFASVADNIPAMLNSCSLEALPVAGGAWHLVESVGGDAGGGGPLEVLASVDTCHLLAGDPSAVVGDGLLHYRKVLPYVAG